MSETDASENGGVSGVRCLAAIFASVLAILGLTIIGELSLPSGSAVWKLLSPVALAIASAVLMFAVPGINAFSKTKPRIIAVAIAVIFAIHLSHWNVKPEMAWMNQIKSYPLHWQILVIPTVCVISPIVEEIYFRGLLFPIIGINWGPKVAAVITGIAFLALHMSLDVFLATLIYTLLIYCSRSVYPSVTAHIAYNSLLLVRAVTWQS